MKEGKRSWLRLSPSNRDYQRRTMKMEMQKQMQCESDSRFTFGINSRVTQRVSRGSFPTVLNLAASCTRVYIGQWGEGNNAGRIRDLVFLIPRISSMLSEIESDF